MCRRHGERASGEHSELLNQRGIQSGVSIDPKINIWQILFALQLHANGPIMRRSIAKHTANSLDELAEVSLRCGKSLEVLKQTAI